ncbi:hypothetical protein K470DRAFT_274219 [Piedraia hortae CBS 480.64]|uniref:Uncharacterized protein n=1 Tax=Piedraia hortae CBS 480.64 TaxID=1314780 RepID=A0A6A7C897_9PEZI|nr:hypothetical protein K470DRAFT_274219 [Piedraia hortae CBS 480.64]
MRSVMIRRTRRGTKERLAVAGPAAAADEEEEEEEEEEDDNDDDGDDEGGDNGSLARGGYGIMSRERGENGAF